MYASTCSRGDRMHTDCVGLVVCDVSSAAVMVQGNVHRDVRDLLSLESEVGCRGEGLIAPDGTLHRGCNEGWDYCRRGQDASNCGEPAAGVAGAAGVYAGTASRWAGGTCGGLPFSILQHAS